ncbi:MAG: tetratricopeptide repeat protein, partial [Gemmatimonadales bacterium]
IDTSFAMAWRKLAVLLSNHLAPYAKIADASEHAYRHRDRLPELEKQATIGWYFDQIEHDPAKAAAAYRAMLAIDPGSDIALNNLALLDISQRRFAEAESLAVRCVSGGEFANCPLNAIAAQLAQGAPARAESTYQLWKRNSPGDPNMRASGVLVAEWQHDFPEAERRNRETAAAAPTPFWKDVAAGDFASVDGMQGHIAKSEAAMREAASVDEAAGAMGMYFYRVAKLAQLDLRHQVHVGAAMAALADARSKHPLNSVDPTERQYPQLAIAYVLGGKVDEARSLMAEYARTVPALVQKGDPDRLEALGNIAMAEGRNEESLKDFQAERADNTCTLCGTFEVAAAYAKLNQPDSARAYYGEYLKGADGYRQREDIDHLAATYQRLGELYEAKGDRAKARESYGKLLDLWKTADPELQPIVADTKERVARLREELCGPRSPPGGLRGSATRLF